MSMILYYSSTFGAKKNNRLQSQKIIVVIHYLHRNLKTLKEITIYFDFVTEFSFEIGGNANPVTGL